MKMETAVLKRSVLTGLALSSLVLASGCVPPRAFDTSPDHITRPSPAAVPASPPPAPVKAVPALSPPKPGVPVPTYTVVVNDVPVKDLLFSIARDTQYNIDLYPGISGNVSLNAVQEPLPAILDRIARQADLRYEMNGRTVSIMPDTPYAKTYTVNYVNVARNTTSSVGVAAQIASTGGGIGTGTGAGGVSASASAGNSSTTTVASQSNSDLWTVLADNIRTLLAGTRAVTQSTAERAAQLDAEKAERAERVSQAEAASKAGPGAANLFTAAFANQPTGDGKYDVAINPVAGTVTVLGTSRQQELVQQYLDRVMQSAQRQVLIEATIVEVTLKDQYRAGIDWSKALQGATGWKITTSAGGGASALAGTLSPFIQATYTNSGNNGFTAAIDLLESFGKTRVLSSPKLMALNNQTALLKVVDNLVYFSVQAQQGTLSSSGSVLQPATFTTTAHTVPVGVVMSVLPQINENGMVSLTVRPTISRKVGDATDPNPSIPATVPNKIPIIQVREMESLLQVRSGQTVVLGGLIQDDSDNARDGLPVLSRPEGIGALFGQHERKNNQTELVIFLRPTVVSNPTLDSDELRQFQRLLPAARSTQ
ncbi:MAG: pilus (MSHA type) biogenesis protein MshL [Hydrogenophilales bacterium]|nr:pilus (MSHA type) biogenesis protein MshL [Hydrogenophilales bacterium]